ncbi:MAG TPA: ABC transporter substrate-binding protein [Candidatus Sulfotelmatobacter sp.]|nr:ABC transporter substrate-binding protein [Candidatus Sulfotelmatobacter sp.]
MMEPRRAVTLFVFVTCLSVGFAASAARAQAPIKIGFLAPLTGSLAQTGKDLYSGCELYWEQNGWQAGGRKLEVTLEDDEGVPATALSKLRRLVESEKVHIVAGVVPSNVAYALIPYIEAQGIPAIYPLNAADDITQRKPPKWLIRTGHSASQITHPFGEYAAKVLGYKRVAVISMDYAFGHETVGGFQRTFEENGGRIVQKLWIPLNVQDYAPYLAQIKKDADAVFTLALGRYSILFAKQYAEAGLKERLPLLGSGTYTDEHVLPQLGDESLGVITAYLYSAALETPANRAFRGAYETKYKRSPSFYSESCYVGAQVISGAIQAVGGRVEDRAALMAALRAADIKGAPRGPIRIDSYGNPIENIYIRKVERVNGKLQNTVIYTYQEVSQFWKYRPEEFLKQPVYSRDYPTCKYC